LLILRSGNGKFRQPDAEVPARIAAELKSDEGWLFAAENVGMEINPAGSEQPGAAPKA
jgi:hypothetical protein